MIIKNHFRVNGFALSLALRHTLQLNVHLLFSTERRIATSSYHGSKLSGSHSFLTETVICVFERWKEIVSYRFVSECNHVKESHTCQSFTFLLSYLQDHGLLRSKNFATMAT